MIHESKFPHIIAVMKNGSAVGYMPAIIYSNRTVEHLKICRFPRKTKKLRLEALEWIVRKMDHEGTWS